MRLDIRKILAFSLVIVASLNCKPRRSVSGLNEAGEFGSTYLEIQRTITEFELRAKLYEQLPLIDESVSDWVRQKGANPSNRVSAPESEGCPAEVWNRDLSWSNKLVGDLVTAAEKSPHFQVRMYAVKTLILYGNRHSMDCASQKIEELMFTKGAFRDEKIDPKFVTNDPNAGVVCSSLLRCSIALEVGVLLASNYPNTDLSTRVFNAVNAVFQSINFLQESRDYLTYRVQSGLAFQKFMRLTQFQNSEFRGSIPVLAASNPEVQQLRGELDGLIRAFQPKYQAFVENPDRLTTKNGFIANEFVDNVYKLDVMKDSSKRAWGQTEEQDKILMDLVKPIWQPALDNYKFNIGLRYYLERLETDDPRPWLQKVKERAVAFRKLKEQSDFLYDGAPVPEAERQKILSGMGVNANDPMTDPVAVFLALTTFIDKEIYMPFRANFREAINYVVEQMNKAERMDIMPKLAQVDATFVAYEQHLQTYGGTLVNLPTSDIMLRPEQKQEVGEMRQMIGRLMAVEPAMVDDPNWKGFVSVQHQVTKFSRLLMARAAVVGGITEYLKKGTWERFSDKHGSMPVLGHLTVPVLWNPDSKVDRLQFDLFNATNNLMAQYLVLECADRIRAGGGGRGLAIKKPFFIDEATTANFQCNKSWSYTQLTTEANKEASRLTQRKVEEKLDRSIAEHPLLHTAMTIAMCAVVPHISALAVRSVAMLGRFVPVAVQTTMAMRAVIWFGRLAIDSFVFGIGDFYFRQGLNAITGMKPSPAEAAAQVSALFNWKGIATGALIFGIIPMAHGPVDRIVRGVFGPSVLGKELYNKTLQSALFRSPAAQGAVQQLTTKELSRQGALWMLSTGAQMTAETSIFVFHPMLEEEGHKIWETMKGTYREPSEMEKIWQRLHTPDKISQVLSSFVTVTAFTTNRLMGHASHNSGFDMRMDRQLKFYGANRYSDYYQHTFYDPIVELGMYTKGEATPEASKTAFESQMRIFAKEIAKRDAPVENLSTPEQAKFVEEVKAKFNAMPPASQFKFAYEIRRRVLAKRMLTNEIEWSLNPQREVKELEPFGLEFAFDKKFDKPPREYNNAQQGAAEQFAPALMKALIGSVPPVTREQALEAAAPNVKNSFTLTSPTEPILTKEEAADIKQNQPIE
jgi:hypothetical protein